MQDYYLKFDSESQANALLFDNTPEGTLNRYRNMDVIGVIYEETGNIVIQDGMEVPEVAPIPGWHVNVRVIDGEDGGPLEPYRVYPQAPRRVWA